MLIGWWSYSQVVTLKCGSVVVSLREKGMSLEVLGACCGKKREISKERDMFINVI